MLKISDFLIFFLGASNNNNLWKEIMDLQEYSIGEIEKFPKLI
jgi:hypothetical protein